MLTVNKGILEVYGGKKLYPLGSEILDCMVKDRNYSLEVYVVQEDTTPLLGLRSYVDMKLIKRVSLLQDSKQSLIAEYKDIFTGIGKFPTKCGLQVDSSIVPTIKAPRRIPSSLQEPVKIALQRLEMEDIIKRVESRDTKKLGE